MVPFHKVMYNQNLKKSEFKFNNKLPFYLKPQELQHWKISIHTLNANRSPAISPYGETS